MRRRNAELDRLWDECNKMERRIRAGLHPLATVLEEPGRFQGPRPVLDDLDRQNQQQ